MSRNVIVGAVVVLIGAIAAVIWTQSAQTPVAVVSQPAPAADGAPAADLETADLETAVQETQNTAEAAQEVASEAVETATEAVSDAVQSVTGAAAEAVSAASDAAGAATEDATAAVSDAVEATENAVGDAVAALTESTPEAGAVPESAPASEPAPELDLETLLTPDGFDVDKVLEAVAASDLGAIAKTALATLVEQVRNNPELTESVIGQVKQALGL